MFKSKNDSLLENRQWLKNARNDVDSDPESWVSPEKATSKHRAILSYLDTILDELGFPSKCPHCGRSK